MCGANFTITAPFGVVTISMPANRSLLPPIDLAINDNEGALVLSATAGSFDELGEYAVVVDDPLDLDETAAAMERALALTEEERRRMAGELRRIVDATRPEDWINAQLDDLTALRDDGEPLSPPVDC